MQSVHTEPPEPHAEFTKPATQPFRPSQQPSAQVVLSHGGGGASHWPKRQISTPPSLEIKVQSWHCPPPAPHCVSVAPLTQTLFEQQPLQLLGPQSCAWQKPPLHVSPKARQSLHACPPNPQAVSDAPGAHIPPAQQPGQLPGPQLVPLQKPFWHVAPKPHRSQRCPLRPQAKSSVPPRQFPNRSQHPPQFCGPHGEGTHAAPRKPC
jgi:hypothetical protein